MLGHIADDGPEVVQLQAFAGQLAVQGLDGAGRIGLRHADRVPRRQAQLREGAVGQAQFIARQAIAAHHMERGQNAAAIGTDLDFGEGLEALCPVDRAIAVHVGHVLVVGVDPHAPQAQARCVGRRVGGEGVQNHRPILDPRHAPVRQLAYAQRCR